MNPKRTSLWRFSRTRPGQTSLDIIPASSTNDIPLQKHSNSNSNQILPPAPALLSPSPPSLPIAPIMPSTSTTRPSRSHSNSESTAVNAHSADPRPPPLSTYLPHLHSTLPLGIDLCWEGLTVYTAPDRDGNNSGRNGGGGRNGSGGGWLGKWGWGDWVEGDERLIEDTGSRILSTLLSPLQIPHYIVNNPLSRKIAPSSSSKQSASSKFHSNLKGKGKASPGENGVGNGNANGYAVRGRNDGDGDDEDTTIYGHEDEEDEREDEFNEEEGRKLIRDLEGVVFKGEFLLILGRPASGVTTLLRALSSTLPPSLEDSTRPKWKEKGKGEERGEGKISYGKWSNLDLGNDSHSLGGRGKRRRRNTWNGEDLEQGLRIGGGVNGPGDIWQGGDWLRSRICMVEETDLHFPTLSIEQNLDVVSKGRTPANWQRAEDERWKRMGPRGRGREETERIKNGKEWERYHQKTVAHFLGIGEEKTRTETQVGDETLRGISGGERKRLSVAELLLARPSLLFLDNATSGLDSSTALGMVRFLKRYAKVGRRGVVAGLRQVGDGIWEEVDKVCVMHRGRCVFFGRREDVRPYWERIGFERGRGGTGGEREGRGGWTGAGKGKGGMSEADWVLSCTDDEDWEVMHSQSSQQGPKTSQPQPQLLPTLNGKGESPFKQQQQKRPPRGAVELEKIWKASPERKRLREEIEIFHQNVGGEDDLAFALAAREEKHHLSSTSTPSFFARWLSRLTFGVLQPGYIPFFTVSPTSRYTTNFITQVQFLTARQYHLILRDLKPLLTKTLVNILLSLLVGLVFFQLPSTSTGAFTRTSLLFLSLLFNGYLQLAELSNALAGRPIVRRQGEWGIYRAGALAVARVGGDLPLIAGQVAIFGTVSYFLGGLQPRLDKFLIYIAFVFATALNLTTVFRMFASLSSTFDDAMRLCGVALNIFVVYAGYFIPTPAMRPALKWVHYVLDPIGYGYEAVLSNEFQGLTLTCSPEHTVPSGPEYTDPLYQTCTLPGSRPHSLTISGSDYAYAAYGFEYKNLGRDMGIILVLAVVFGMIGVWCSDLMVGGRKGRGSVRIFARNRRAKERLKRKREKIRRKSEAAENKMALNGRDVDVVHRDVSTHDGDGTDEGSLRIGMKRSAVGLRKYLGLNSTKDGRGEYAPVPSSSAEADFESVEADRTKEGSGKLGLPQSCVPCLVGGNGGIEEEDESLLGSSRPSTVVDFFGPEMSDGNSGPVCGNHCGSLAWRNISLSVPTASAPAQLLNSVSGYIRPGQCTALLGASGAGKTTLLNALAGKPPLGSRLTGTILFDGQIPTRAFYRKTGFVEQLDMHDPFTTVREAVEFSAYMRQSSSSSESSCDVSSSSTLGRSGPISLGKRSSRTERNEAIEARVEAILELMDLMEVQDAVVGTPECGLGLEQRKRLSIAVELVFQPALVFLDEPTSGLDSQSALHIAHLMRRLSRTGIAVLATIHQPSVEIFQCFDNLCLLERGGYQVYFGPRETALQFFGSARPCGPNCSCHPDENPAEFLLDCVGAGVGATGASSQGAGGGEASWVNNWQSSEAYSTLEETIEGLEEIARKEGNKPKWMIQEEEKGMEPGLSTQIWCLTARVSRNFWRDSGFSFTKVFTSIVVALVIGLSFSNIENTAVGLRNRMFSVFLILFIPPVWMNVSILKTFSLRGLWHARELPNGTVGPISWCASIVLAEIPYALVCGTMFWVIWYFSIGYPLVVGTMAFAYMLVILFFLFQSFWALWIQAMSPTLGVVANLLPFFLVSLEIFNGSLMPYSEMHKFWRVLYWISPFQWYVRAMLATLLHSIPIFCHTSELAIFSSPPNLSCSQYVAQYLSTNPGYLTNPDDPTIGNDNCQLCQYSTGDDFLATLNITFDSRWRAVGIFAAYTFINVVLFFVLTWWRTPRRRAKGGAEEREGPTRYFLKGKRMGFVRKLGFWNV